MKILVLNGSPKGDLSITMQYVAFLQKMNPQHTLKILNIAQQVRQIEQDEQKFNKVMAEIENADGVLWAFPLYVFLVHSQYKRFIELIFERNRTAVFQAKYTAVLSTSIHFFDHTAHQYMRGICDDLNMSFCDSFSAGMRDLFKETERNNLSNFFNGFLDAIQRKAYCATSTFLGVGGIKIFRDEIWGPLRFPFVAAHQYYRQQGLYDFPQNDYASRARNFFLGLLAKFPAIRKELYGQKMTEYMIRDYKSFNEKGCQHDR